MLKKMWRAAKELLKEILKNSKIKSNKDWLRDQKIRDQN
jgi:hypothetical protein